MDTPVRRIGALAAAALFVVAACTGSATTAPSTAASPSAAASASAQASPSGAASASAQASPSAAGSASPVASVPASALIDPGKLTVCSDIPYAPQEMFDPTTGEPTGSDIDIAREIGARLGLGLAVNNTVFDTIIAALQGQKCDIIVSAQNITADRVKQVDMIPYFKAGQSFVVAKGNPKAINTTDDLCGKTIAAETGTTEVDYLEGTHAYSGKGLTQACTGKGKPAITTKQFEKDSDAQLALQAGQVDAYFADQPVATNLAITKADQFELAPIAPLAPALEGISVLKTNKDLETAVQKALVSMIDDGTYVTILKKYKMDTGAITSADANQLNKTS